MHHFEIEWKKCNLLGRELEYGSLSVSLKVRAIGIISTYTGTPREGNRRNSLQAIYSFMINILEKGDFIALQDTSDFKTLPGYWNHNPV